LHKRVAVAENVALKISKLRPRSLPSPRHAAVQHAGAKQPKPPAWKPHQSGRDALVPGARQPTKTLQRRNKNNPCVPKQWMMWSKEFQRLLPNAEEEKERQRQQP
jgi:hypothetical protein